MRIGLFPAMLGRRAGGPETYERELLRALAQIDTQNDYHVWFANQRAAEVAGLGHENFTSNVLWPSVRWIHMGTTLPLAARRLRVRLLHATFVPPPICPVDLAFTMHGSVTFSHPQFYQRSVLARLNPLLLRGLQRAKLTVCVSDFVKQEMMEYFDVPEDRLLTVYHGVSSRFRPDESGTAEARARANFKISGPYVLYVGKLHTNKNIVRLIEAFHIATRGIEEIQLLLVGRMFYGSDDIERTVQRLGLAARLHRLGHLHEDCLPALYAGAQCMVFPTLWEGFGLPMVEAMACGTPLIASNIACVPEITGAAALLVDPFSVEAIADAIQRVLSSAALRADLRRRGLARAAHFNWEQTARQTLQCYERVAAA